VRCLTVHINRNAAVHIFELIKDDDHCYITLGLMLNFSI